ncbi:MAG: hypothetical protein ACE5IJ_10950 [Thermoplasmata archaeon]
MPPSWPCQSSAIIAVVQNTEEVPVAAWIVGLGFIGLEVYFFGTLLRAWIRDRRANAVSKCLELR